MENGVVGSVAVGTLTEDKVVETGVNGADGDWVRTHPLDSFANILNHERIQYCISILEAGIIIATVYLTA